jgi:predicted metal-dependent hydrolase
MSSEEANPAGVPTSRPALDAFWLNKLHHEGIHAFLPEAPSLSPSFTLSLQQLQQGTYFEAHESLEDLWGEASYPLKLFYYALIKVAVGLLQIERRNAKAATAQLVPAIQYLAPFTPAFLGVQTGALAQEAQDRLALLQVGESTEMWDAVQQMPPMAFPTTPT